MKRLRALRRDARSADPVRHGQASTTEVAA